MNEAEPRDDEMTGFVQALAERVPESDAPVPRVLAAAREAARRRSRRRGAGLVAAAVAFVVAAAVIPAAVDGGHSKGVSLARPPTATPTATPLEGPPGTKLVGADGVAISIPDTWTQVPQPLCGPPDHAYYYLADSAHVVASCVNSPDSIALAEPSLEIDASTDAAAASPPSCSGGSCAETWVRRGVSFTATVFGDSASARGQLDTIGASLRDVPPGYVTIPGWPLSAQGSSEYVDALDRAGLRGVVGATVRAQPHLTHPAQGSVVPVGSTVTLGTPTQPERVTTQDVGTHGVQVTIPASWQQVPQPICGAAALNSYSLDTVSTAEYRCPQSRPATNDSLHLAVGAARVYGLRGDPDRRVRTLDGLRVVTAAARCGRGRCQQVWSLSQQRLTVVAQVSASRRGLLSQIGSSIRPVPAGYVTVPDVSTQDLARAESLIESAGLVYAYDGLLAAQDVELSPAPGAVVPLGSTVHVSAS